MGRYDRNGIFTDQDMEILKKSKVCIVGCGGLGGYTLEFIARVGIREITVVDGDVFDETNLNRQLLSMSDNLGEVKVLEAKKRISLMDPETQITAVHDYLGPHNAGKIIDGMDIVIDALDNIPIRLVLQQACEEKNIPLVHGAIAGWYGQVTTVMPGDRTLNRVYPSGQRQGIETEIGNPSFTPAYVSSIQVSEALKVLTDKGEILRNQMMYIDLLDNEVHILPI